MLMPSMRRVDSMERRDSGRTVWHSVAASALHRMTSKSRRSRARSGQLQCRVSPQAIVRDKLLLVMIYSSGGTSVCSTGLLNSDAKQSISITS